LAEGRGCRKEQEQQENQSGSGFVYHDCIYFEERWMECSGNEMPAGMIAGVFSALYGFDGPLTGA
jgi:hypothetical protein